MSAMPLCLLYQALRYLKLGLHKLGLLATPLWLLPLLALAPGAQAQMGGPPKGDVVSWTMTVQPAQYAVGDVVKLRLEATIQKGFHMFSAVPAKNGGYLPTSITLENPVGLERLPGVAEEGKLHKEHDDIMEDDLLFYHDRVVFTVSLKITGKNPQANVLLKYQYCTDNEGQCYPGQWEKKLALTPADKPADSKDAAASADSANAEKVEPAQGATPPSPYHESNDAQKPTQAAAEAGNILWLFLRAFGYGLLALFTPCVFPMVPMTVSFFTKRAKDRKQGIRDAFTYALSIVFIFVVIGLLLTVLTGDSDTLYNLTTNPWVNLFFFAMLVAFGLSFLGWFEIQLPSSWANKVDSKSQRGGMIGIFFMALTLVLVSFSCTGPLVGTLLVDVASGKSYLGPIVGMTGFSMGFAIPFGVFALFPGLLSSLPKSGGWLNSVKVVLGFLELSLALKFLSNADLVWHTGLLDREVFITGWIALFALLTLYLLGRLYLPHDTPLARVSWPRLGLAAVSFFVVLYLLPGLWGAPLHLLEGILPPEHAGQIGVALLDAAPADAATGGLLTGVVSRELALAVLVVALLLLGLWAVGKVRLKPAAADTTFVPVSVPRVLLATGALWLAIYMITGLWGAPLKALDAVLPPVHADMGVRVLPQYQTADHGTAATCNLPADRILADRLAKGTPPGFCAFFDLDEAQAYAKKVNKPLMLDFTGHTCANCRRMEKSVWRDADVRRLITQEYILVSLYTDEPEALPQVVELPETGTKLRTVGDKWLHLQKTRYGTSAQPYYVLVDAELRTLAPPVGYEPDIATYRAFLEAGLKEYGK